MLVIAVVLIIMMFTSGQKETYYGYMKDATTADKVISEKDHKSEKNVKLPSKSDFSPKCSIKANVNEVSSDHVPMG